MQSMWMWWNLLMVVAAAEPVLDYSGGYIGTFDSTDAASAESGKIWFSLNRTQHADFDTIQGSFGISGGKDATASKFWAYGWFMNDTLTLYSNVSRAIQNPPANYSVRNRTFKAPPPGDWISRNWLYCDLVITLAIDSVEEHRSRKDIHVTGTSAVPPEASPCRRPMELTISASSFSEEAFLSKARRYAYMMILGNIVQIYFLAKQMEYSASSARAQKLSILTFGFLGYYDSYLIVLHSYYGVGFESLFNTFMILSFTQFIIFSVLEMRIMLLITKARYPESFQGDWENVRRQLGNLYLRFYVLLFFGVVTLYVGRIKMVIPAFYSFWIPQIIHSVKSDTNKAFSQRFIVATTVIKMLFPGYWFGCPEQMLFPRSGSSDWSYLTGVYSYLWIQAIFLMALNHYGPRFFIPLKWQPERYQYYRFSVEEGSENPECAICFNPLTDDDPVNDVMVTPCDHAFHDHCLTRWMEQQMKCPTCRGELPPP